VIEAVVARSIRAFSKLVDIAERSIAQPFDDLTTTVQAIYRLHECLRQLAPAHSWPESTTIRGARRGC
jgi:uncharacterized membrane protein